MIIVDMFLSNFTELCMFLLSPSPTSLKVLILRQVPRKVKSRLLSCPQLVVLYRILDPDRLNWLTWVQTSSNYETYTFTACYLMEQRTANSISLGTNLGLFWGVTSTITITSLHEALQVCEHCDHDDHVRRLSRQSRTPSLAATTNVVSRGSHVRCLSRRSRMLFL